MSHGQFAQEYRKNTVSTSSPLQLIIMLYDGAIKFMELGKQALTKNDHFQKNHNLQKAQRIISELSACLDMEKGGEIAQNLFELYSFAFLQLVEANVQDDITKIDAAMKVLRDLRESWVQVERESRGNISGGQLAA